MITITFIVQITLVFRTLYKRITKGNIIVWPIVTASVLMTLVLILSFNPNYIYTNWFLVSSLFFIELYFLYLILYFCFEKKTSITRILILSTLFIVIGYFAIYISSYGYNGNNDLFNSLITLFSAIVGGAVTLSGVAWTIVDNRDRQKRDEILKYKPYLNISNKKTTNIVYTEPIIDEFHNICSSNIDYAFAYLIHPITIKNSANADFILTGIIINNTPYNVQNYFLGKDNIVTINTTCNHYVNSIECPTSIKVLGKDLLDNTYEYDCTFIKNTKVPGCIKKGNKIINIVSYDYKITKIDLPKLL